MAVKGEERASVKISLLAMFSVFAYLAALFVKLTVSYGAIIYAIVILIGALVVRKPYSATVISLVAGLLYSFQSYLFLLMLGTFIIRGITIDLLFWLLGVYKQASRGIYKVLPVIVTMVLSSFFSGLYQYLFITLFLGKLVDFGAFIVSTIFLVALISNAIAGWFVPKYVMPKLNALGYA